MTTLPTGGYCLPPLLHDLLPSRPVSGPVGAVLLRVQHVLDTCIAPTAVQRDRTGGYPHQAIAALKPTGILALAVPVEWGGMGMGQDLSLELMLRLAVADPAVAQIYKVHDDLLREIFAYAPAGLKAELGARIVSDHIILGMAVAENGRTADSFLQTLAQPGPEGTHFISGRKIYATGASGADLVAVSSFDPVAAQKAGSVRAGVRMDLVPRNTPGLAFHHDWNRMGQRATDSGTVTLDRVRVADRWNALLPDADLPRHVALRFQAGFSAILTGIGIGAVRAVCAFVPRQARPWGAAGVESADQDPYVRRLLGEIGADLFGAYCAVMAAGRMLDQYEQGQVSRNAVAMAASAARSVATRAGLRAASDAPAAAGARGTDAANAFDRYWRDARTISLHDPVDWKNAEIGRHLLTGWVPEPGLYQ
ncbi:acyl-CoA dehydrogenase [Komagataeibacter rhaeticus]|uniref:Dibenzothiophene monooxygenase n=1 Tax=Komagataeibacter rhaeticus TaxID=215221 RepID=A0A181CCS2_9PROT|nr:acyl-CoA dehydrogenase family protein [Komagataeibacter rhaeticus]ATU71837.1 acyl-CoA dehydrogenase [Komagataeibacter xylinus]KDU95878.1 acyl-CoA dehydrogenase [Komagataeibacter rhaeticus AF1]MBL7240104.1 acyl-CoA dehydrogenase family protein [Komagataeibacter rhaeticus]PYD54739.1 acyl-CoA dehydrogenase [Komagataeibacter rhaeticus]QIP36041.1 acyl-CoA dehydrogenase [Komagataeibacter rhaeticus]